MCANPRAHVDPEQNPCVGQLRVVDDGRKTIQEIAFIGLEKMGGPMVVFPPPPPPGSHGGNGDPYPGPKP